MLKRLLQLTGAVQEPESRASQIHRNLIKRESKIGGELFGPIAPGGRREFFCLDEHTWIWYEEWQDTSGNQQSRTTRYDVRPNGVVKAQDGRHYQKLSSHEAKRFREAVLAYQKRVFREIYTPVLQ